MELVGLIEKMMNSDDEILIVDIYGPNEHAYVIIEVM